MCQETYPSEESALWSFRCMPLALNGTLRFVIQRSVKCRYPELKVVLLPIPLGLRMWGLGKSKDHI